MAIITVMMNISIKMLDNISQTIRTARKTRGLSQQELADLVQLDRTTIGALERNDYQDLGIRKVERVLTMFGMTLNSEKILMPTLDDLTHQNELARHSELDYSKKHSFS